MAEGKLYRFYKSKEWLALKEKILVEAHYECEMCRKRGRISRAVTVHHVQYVKKHPELALSRYYTYNGVAHKNLIPLCHACHDEVHDRFGHGSRKKETFNEERW